MKLHKPSKLNPHQLSAAVAALTIVATVAIMTTGPAWAQSHDHGAAPQAKLSLDHGRKWATDDALRAGMGRIRALVEPSLDAAHAGKLTPAQYAALAGKVQTEVGGIVANCKLEPQADAMLHLVIGEIGAGTDAMTGKAPGARPSSGLVKVATAVNDYGRHFEHSGFKLIALSH